MNSMPPDAPIPEAPNMLPAPTPDHLAKREAIIKRMFDFAQKNKDHKDYPAFKTAWDALKEQYNLASKDRETVLGELAKVITAYETKVAAVPAKPATPELPAAPETPFTKPKESWDGSQERVTGLKVLIDNGFVLMKDGVTKPTEKDAEGEVYMYPHDVAASPQFRFRNGLWEWKAANVQGWEPIGRRWYNESSPKEWNMLARKVAPKQHLNLPAENPEAVRTRRDGIMALKAMNAKTREGKNPLTTDLSQVEYLTPPIEGLDSTYSHAAFRFRDGVWECRPVQLPNDWVQVGKEETYKNGVIAAYAKLGKNIAPSQYPAVSGEVRPTPESKESIEAHAHGLNALLSQKDAKVILFNGKEATPNDPPNYIYRAYANDATLYSESGPPLFMFDGVKWLWKGAAKGDWELVSADVGVNDKWYLSEKYNQLGRRVVGVADRSTENQVERVAQIQKTTDGHIAQYWNERNADPINTSLATLRNMRRAIRTERENWKFLNPSSVPFPRERDIKLSEHMRGSVAHQDLLELRELKQASDTAKAHFDRVAASGGPGRLQALQALIYANKAERYTLYYRDYLDRNEESRVSNVNGLRVEQFIGSSTVARFHALDDAMKAYEQWKGDEKREARVPQGEAILTSYGKVKKVQENGMDIWRYKKMPGYQDADFAYIDGRWAMRFRGSVSGTSEWNRELNMVDTTGGSGTAERKEREEVNELLEKLRKINNNQF